MERWYYVYAGLRVTSELKLPEWNVFEQPHPFDQPDVFISLHPAQDETHAAESFQIVRPEEYHFRIPHTAEYRVRHGSEIDITPTAQAGALEIRLFLLGSAWGALSYQRGLLFLHASVVCMGDSAIALCGPTGSGKSTLAAWLVERGGQFVGDDLCRFEVTAEGPARVYPSAPRLKLWRDALAAMGQSEEGLTRDHFRMDKYHVDLTGLSASQSDTPTGSEPLPLRAIYLLDWGDTAVTRLSGSTALRRFVSYATYRGEFLEPMNQVAAHWQRCAELAQNTPIFLLKRPRNWLEMARISEFLTTFQGLVN